MEWVFVVVGGGFCLSFFSPPFLNNLRKKFWNQIFQSPCGYPSKNIVPHCKMYRIIKLSDLRRIGRFTDINLLRLHENQMISSAVAQFRDRLF